MKKVLSFLSLGLAVLALSSTSSAFGRTEFIFSGTHGPYGNALVLNGNPVATSFTGWYENTGFHDASNPNYIAGLCSLNIDCGRSFISYHDFFIFAIPAGTYSSAVLHIYNPGVGAGDPFNGFVCPCSHLNYTNWDVTTAISTLEATNSGEVGIYNDLGSGVQYGHVVVTPASDGTYVNITLDAAALTAINAAAGGTFAIGGAIGPEPGTLLLLGTGLVGAVGAIRRRNAQGWTGITTRTH